MLTWRVYYGGGSTFDSSQGEPQDAPAVNVQHIVCRDTRNPSNPAHIGRYIVSGKDYYWYDKGGWWGGDIFGLFIYLATPGLKIVKMGQIIGNEEWLALSRRAHADPDFPPKSAYVDGEFRPTMHTGQDEVSV